MTWMQEWSLGKFLTENLTQTQINVYLKLAWFDDWSKPSFTLAWELLNWMDILPSGPKWQVMELEVEGYKLDRKVELICLFKNPIFTQSMSFNPIRVWSSLPISSTIVPIIATSDKTSVTRQTAISLPLFITIGNIDSNVHMKATVHAWQYMAFMPISKFNTHLDYQIIL
ncbi:hypothetical protein HD554DRAFT_2201369 [Boletus coccyginus]|nr:hypothetical protein HD554DRAFT_2201369 [Boletus coccyginus]